jgi:DNA-binding HxlR family transcriptional regulator
MAAPLNVAVLQALADEPCSLIDLRRAAGSPPQTTMRGHLRALTELGVLERRRQDGFPGTVDFELTAGGRELLWVSGVVSQWLELAPDGPLALGSPPAKSAIKALVAGWSTNLVRALAARPLSLTELDALISSVSYPSLERRLAAMRLAGLVEKVRGEGRGTPYGVTQWLRMAMGPIAAATRWERRFAPGETPPVGDRDVEAALLLSVPLLRVSPALAGSCRLAVEVGNGRGDRLAGVMVKVAEGRVVSCISRLEGHPDAWAVGSPRAWLSAVLERDPELLEVGGDASLPRALLDSLWGALFRSRT